MINWIQRKQSINSIEKSKTKISGKVEVKPCLANRDELCSAPLSDEHKGYFICIRAELS